MILQDNFLKNNLGVIALRPYNYIIIDTKHFEFTEDKEVLAAGIEICNLTNILRMVNDFYNKHRIKKKIDFSILSKVHYSIFTNEAMEKNELEILFMFMKEIDNLAQAMNNISSALMEQVYIPTNIVMVLIGFGWEKQREFKNQDKKHFGFVEEKFFNLEMMVEKNTITVDEFIKQGLELLEYNLEQAKKETFKTK